MNEVMNAAETQEEHGKEAHDFVEMGTVSGETKGSFSGDFMDGAQGRFKVG